MKMIEFHIPVRPYSPIDAHNRAAAAKGSPRYAQMTSGANYNGHHVTLAWNDYRGYYVAEYYWAGRCVIGRGDFASCLRAVIEEYNRGALGASASIIIPENNSAALEIARAEKSLIEGSMWKRGPDHEWKRDLSWWTWRHDIGAESARDMANPRSLTMIFDWNLCQKAADRKAYEEALRAKYGSVYQ